jgi:hypothetical protein
MDVDVDPPAFFNYLAVTFLIAIYKVVISSAVRKIDPLRLL